MSSLLEQGKELTSEIMSEDVPHLRDAVTQAVTSKEGRQSAVTEIWATIKNIWAKIKESGIIAVVIEQVKGIVQKLLNRNNSSGEGAPLLPTSDGDRGLLGNLPNAPESLLARAGDFVDSLPDAITDNLPPAVVEALQKDSKEGEPSGSAAPLAGAATASAGIATLTAVVSEKIPESADPEVDVEAFVTSVAEVVPEPKAVVEAVTEKVGDVVPGAEAVVEAATETVTEAVPEPEAVVEAFTEKVEDVVPEAEAVVEAVTEIVTEAVPEPEAVVETVTEKVEDVVREAEAVVETVTDAVTETVSEPEAVVEAVTKQVEDLVPEAVAEVPEAALEGDVDSIPKLDADAVAPIVADVVRKAEE